MSRSLSDIILGAIKMGYPLRVHHTGSMEFHFSWPKFGFRTHDLPLVDSACIAMSLAGGPQAVQDIGYREFWRLYERAYQHRVRHLAVVDPQLIDESSKELEDAGRQLRLFGPKGEALNSPILKQLLQ